MNLYLLQPFKTEFILRSWTSVHSPWSSSQFRSWNGSWFSVFLTRRWSGSRSLSLGLGSFMELLSFLDSHLVNLSHSVDGSSSGSSTRGALSLGCSEFAEDGFGEFRDLGFGKAGIWELLKLWVFFFFVCVNQVNRSGWDWLNWVSGYVI